MSDRREADRAALDALMYRMLGGLLLVGAAVLIGLALCLLRLPHVSTAGGEALLLPGTAGRHAISTLACPVLLGGGLLLGAPGLLALGLSRRPVRFGGGLSVRPRPRSFGRAAVVLLAGLAVLVAVLLRR